MARIRRLLTLMALLISTAVSAVAAVSVVRQGFPAPSPVATLAAREDIVSFLADSDLLPADRRVKVQLIHRLESEFRQGGDWDAALAALDPPHATRFQNNFAHLMELWFLDKVDRFHALEPENRDAFLDDEIEGILRWKVISAPRAASVVLQPPASPDDNRPDRPDERRRRGRPRPPRPPLSQFGGPTGAVIQAVARIADQARGRQRRRCEEFLAALQLRVISRTIPGFGGN